MTSLRWLRSSLLSCFSIACVITAAAMMAGGQMPQATTDAPRDASESETRDQPPLREQTIYIPFDKLERVFERQGRGVFVPYEKFQALWEAARAAVRPSEDVRPPVGAVIQEIRNIARVEKDVLLVEAKLRIELVTAGWHRIPLRLESEAIRSATIDEQPARIVREHEGSFSLLYEVAAGSQPKTIDLELQYAKAIEKSPGRNRVVLHAPQAAINQWEVRIPESAVKVQVEPLLAVVETPPAEGEQQTVVRAFVGPAEEIRIEWNPRPEGAAGLTALATVDVWQELIVDEAAVRSRAQLTYEVNRAELGEFRVLVPSQYKVVGVFDSNVRQWEVVPAERGQLVLIHLFEPARARQALTIELERFSSDGGPATIAVPVIEALDVGRQQGLVAVRLAETLRTFVERRSGLVQIDVSELPPAWSQQRWDYAFRYATTPYELVLTVEKLAPRVQVQQYAYAYLSPTDWHIDVLAIMQIERAGIFELQLEGPPGWQLRSVRGLTHEGWEGVVVDSYQSDPSRENTVQVHLARKAQGTVAVWCQWVKPLHEPNLLAPTGQSAVLEVSLPKVTAPGLELFRGHLLVLASDSLRAGQVELVGMQSTSLSEAQFPIPNLRRQDGFAQMRESLAFVHGVEPARLTLHVERRKPQLHVRQLVTVRVEPGMARFEAKLLYDIRFSPVKTLRVDIPAALAQRLRNVTPGVRDEVAAPPPADLAEGMVAWLFSGDAEFFGSPVLTLAWQENLPPLSVGQSLPIPIPHVQPQQVERSWGQILIARSETIHLEPESWSASVREIDPRHDLMPDADPSDIARAFEFQDTYQFQLTATRYELVDIKRTSIETALVRAVVTPSRQIDVQALYRVRSVRQRLDVRFPAGVDPQESFDAEPVRINGKAVPMQQGTGGQFHIPLVSVPTNEPFVLEMRYLLNAGSPSIALPDFPEKPAFGRVYLSVYLPEDRKLLAVSGPWTDEQPPLGMGGAALSGGSVRDDGDIYRQDVCDGINVTGDPLARFPVQGNRYLFSTLHPAASPTGDLTFLTADSRIAYAVVIALAALIALVFLVRPLAHKLAALAAIWAAVMATAVLAPTTARHLTDTKVQLAGMGVLGVWFLAEAAKGAAAVRSWTRRRRTTRPGGQHPPPSPSRPSSTPSTPPATSEVEQRVRRVLDEWLLEASRGRQPSGDATEPPSSPSGPTSTTQSADLPDASGSERSDRPPASAAGEGGEP